LGCPGGWVFENAVHTTDRNEADRTSSRVYTTEEVDGIVNGIKSELEKRDLKIEQLTNRLNELTGQNDALVKRISELEGKGQ
jgi:predicted RNase H-like nuclease (RuvC/YqgF family)